MNDNVEQDIFEDIEDEASEAVTEVGGDSKYNASEKKYGVKLDEHQLAAFEEHYQSNTQILQYFKDNGMPYDDTFGVRQLASTRYQLFTKYTTAANKYIAFTDEEIRDKRQAAIDKIEKRLTNIDAKIKEAKAKKNPTDALDASRLKAEGNLVVAKGTLDSAIEPQTKYQVLSQEEFDDFGSCYEPNMKLEEFIENIKTGKLPEIKAKFTDLKKPSILECIVCMYKVQQFRPISEPGTKKTAQPKSIMTPDMENIVTTILADDVID